MPQRLKNPENLKKPILNFKIPPSPYITFSICSTQKLAFAFQTATGDRNDEVSRVLRGFVYKRLGIKNNTEFQKLIEKIPRQEVRKFIYKKIGVKQTNITQTFSKIMEGDIEKYLKKNK